MGDEHDIHDLAAPYALAALEGAELARFERHLDSCATCLEEVVSLQATAAALALDVDASDPPPLLRERILEAARDERPGTVVSLRRRRWVLPATAALAAAAALAAVAVGIWTISLSDDLAHERSARRAEARAAAILADPSSVRYPLSGARGQVVVTRGGDAALVVSGLGRAPRGKTYELWVVSGERPRPAGTFQSGRPSSLVALEQKVPHGAKVAVSLERAGGSPRLTGRLLFAAQTA